MARLLVLTILYLIVISCNKSTQSDLNGVQGKWFLSRQEGVAYTVPKGLLSGVPVSFSTTQTASRDISIHFYDSRIFEYESSFSGRLSGQFSFLNDSTIHFIDINDYFLSFLRGSSVTFVPSPVIGQFPTIPNTKSSDSVVFYKRADSLMIKTYVSTIIHDVPFGHDTILLKSTLTTFKR